MSFDLGCPTGCGRPARAGQLLCAPCWSQVPPDLQRRVHATWRTYRALLGSPRRVGKTAAREEYRAARDAAIARVS